MKEFAAVIAAVAIIGIGLFVEASVWSECRSIHSFLYCIARH